MAFDRPGRGYRKNVGAEPSQENSEDEMAKKVFESLEKGLPLSVDATGGFNSKLVRKCSDQLPVISNQFS